MLVDLRPYNVKGNLAAESLSRANITCNKMEFLLIQKNQ